MQTGAIFYAILATDRTNSTNPGTCRVITWLHAGSPPPVGTTLN